MAPTEMRRESSAFGLGKTVELSLVVNVCVIQIRGPESRKTGQIPCCLRASLGEPVKAILGSSLVKDYKRDARGLTNPATSLAQNQDYKLAQPNSYLICGFLEYMKRMNIQIQNNKIFQTGYSRKVSESPLPVL